MGRSTSVLVATSLDKVGTVLIGHGFVDEAMHWFESALTTFNDIGPTLLGLESRKRYRVCRDRVELYTSERY